MLLSILDINDKLISLIRDDPVRPEIPDCDRIGLNKDVFIEIVDDKPLAVTCVSYQSNVPTNVAELMEWPYLSTVVKNIPDIVVFYTIWSYKPGAGRSLIFSVRDHILKNRINIKRFVTLSPPTHMARKFHLQNGAFELRVNKDTINYEYV